MDDPKALSRRWFEEVWNQRRSETIDELMGTDGVGHMEGGDVTGREEFRQTRERILNAFPDLMVSVDAVIAEGENAGVRWTARGTHRGAGLGIEATGRPAVFRGMTWLRCQGGRIAEEWDSWNMGGLFERLRSPDLPAVSKP